MSEPRSGNTFQTLNVTIASPGTAARLSAYYIPDGFDVVVTARRDNSGNMYIAETQAKAQSGARKIMTPGQSRTYHVDNTARLWIDADNSTDVLEVDLENATAGVNPA